MIGERRVLAVCPARGGSKGIPGKNLKPFCGVPLVARVGHLCRELPVIDRAVVSTDHAEIAEVARAAGLDAPFLRPTEISGDRVGDAAVLLHALEEVERLDRQTYDVVVMLQPTSPLRRASQVVAAVEMLVNGDWDAVWTVSESDSKAHPLKQLNVVDGHLDYYDPAGATIIARQQLTPVYHRNGVAYAMTRSCLVDGRSIRGKRTGALVIDEPMVSIDTLEDLALAEWLHERRSD